MHPVIHLHTRIFDLRAESENPINPIFGSSLLDWLRRHIPAMTLPFPEDWGWYSHLTLDGRNYLIGSCAYESEDGDQEWVLQIDKARSIKEKVLGQAKMATTDPCFVRIYELINREPGFTAVSVEGGA